MEQRLTIIFDPIKNEVRVENPDGFTALESLGLIEFAKIIIHDDWSEKYGNKE